MGSKAKLSLHSAHRGDGGGGGRKVKRRMDKQSNWAITEGYMVQEELGPKPLSPESQEIFLSLPDS